MTINPNQPTLLTTAAFAARADRHRLLADTISRVFLLMPVTKVEINGSYFVLTVSAVNEDSGQRSTIRVAAATLLVVIEP